MRCPRLVFLGLLVASACAREARDPANITVRTYASTAPGSVNTHRIETPSGVIVIDGQRVSSEARHAVREIRRSGKPVLAILVTHPHPDHFGGLGTFVEAFGRDVPIFASQRTIDTIRNDEGGFIRLTEQHYGDDFDEQVTLPDRVVADGQELVLGGVTIKVTYMLVTSRCFASLLVSGWQTTEPVTPDERAAVVREFEARYPKYPEPPRSRT